jgi:ferredoxin
MGYIDKLAESNEIRINYISSILMVDNYLPVFDMEKEIKKKKESEADIMSKISDINKMVNFKKTTRNIFRIISTPIMRSIMKETGMDKKFCISEGCISCGVCQKVCPRNNIVLSIKPSFKNQCCSCLGCVNIYPRKAITIKGERNPNARFRNPNVNLNEIIAANN